MSETQIRRIIRESILSEALTKSDKSEVERIVKRHLKSILSSEISSEIDKEVRKRNGSFEKKVDDTITARFKKAQNDKDFDDAVIRVAKRVLKGLHDMHYKRTNLIDQMPIPKN
ncbi:MAG: hypothetical protein VXZ58_04710 [Actinomycetota bacterium]|nr:hypothetical protein [Actinomycetota bacterium]